MTDTIADMLPDSYNRDWDTEAAEDKVPSLSGRRMNRRNVVRVSGADRIWGNL